MYFGGVLDRQKFRTYKTRKKGRFFHSTSVLLTRQGISLSLSSVFLINMEEKMQVEIERGVERDLQTTVSSLKRALDSIRHSDGEKVDQQHGMATVIDDEDETLEREFKRTRRNDDDDGASMTMVSNGGKDKGILESPFFTPLTPFPVVAVVVPFNNVTETPKRLDDSSDVSLPDDVWYLIASHSPDASVWYALALGIPAVGRWSCELEGKRISDSLFVDIELRLRPEISVRVMKRRKNGHLHSDGIHPAKTINEKDCVYYYRCGKLHRDGNLPAFLENYHGDLSSKGYPPIISDGIMTYDPVEDNKDATNALSVVANTLNMNDVRTISKETSRWTTEKYYRDGLLHRDGDEPAVDHGGDLEYYKNGIRHRDGDKAAIKYHQTNGWELEPNKKEACCFKAYYKNGLRHRDADKPAYIRKRCEFHDKDVRLGYKKKVIYYKNGNKHRKTGPAQIIYHRSTDTLKRISTETYYTRGKIGNANPNEPSIIVHFRDGTKTEEYWWRGKKGRCARSKDPAVMVNRHLPSVIHGPSGDLEYWRHGKRHRDGDFPAEIRMLDGSIVMEVYWKEDVIYRKKGLPSVVYFNKEDKELATEQ